MDNTFLPEELLTTGDVTRIYGVSRVTLWRWIKDGRLTAYKLGPRLTRVRRADVHAMLAPIGQQSPVAANQLAAVREIERVQQNIRMRRGGRVLGESADVIARTRDDRESP